MWTGDTIYGKNPDDAKLLHKEYKEFLDIAKTAGVPVFNAPGNLSWTIVRTCPTPRCCSTT